mmetsp:Transcript_25832/g.37833  ORF Transcript_25832/g.37833 Transcript_25832/m.37833 type:complete len:92 (+) Transcript_25832:2423-2698(+)
MTSVWYMYGEEIYDLCHPSVDRSPDENRIFAISLHITRPKKVLKMMPMEFEFCYDQQRRQVRRAVMERRAYYYCFWCCFFQGFWARDVSSI